MNNREVDQHLGKEELEGFVEEFLEERSIDEYESFEAFWEDFVTSCWYEAQDAGDDPELCRGDIEEIFAKLAAA